MGTINRVAVLAVKSKGSSPAEYLLVLKKDCYTVPNDSFIGTVQVAAKNLINGYMLNPPPEITDLTESAWEAIGHTVTKTFEPEPQISRLECLSDGDWQTLEGKLFEQEGNTIIPHPHILWVSGGGYRLPLRNTAGWFAADRLPSNISNLARQLIEAYDCYFNTQPQQLTLGPGF
ncbi:MAG: hypothetical protein ABIG95_06280 [Candidatus Woesearchaeota archaeon]